VFCWYAGPESVDFCHEHGVDFVLGGPVVEFSGFGVPVLYWKSLYVPKHYPVIVFLFRGRFLSTTSSSGRIWVRYRGERGSGETCVCLFQLMSLIRWNGVETKCSRRSRFYLNGVLLLGVPRF
jgi:hypothetical protein